MRILERASNTRLPILILGETGTGKEALARAAHSLSDRSGHVFVVGHCAARPDGQLDVELFGKDAAGGPGGDRARTGLFETAHRGVIFLDEVSELLTAAQAKLLRVIEMGELRRVGGMGLRQVDVRVIAASTRDLGGLVRRGLFRDDLYYRLNGIRLSPAATGPPRRRRADRPLPARARCAQRRTSLEQSVGHLASYPWPGNVRELWNVNWTSLAKDSDHPRGSRQVQLSARGGAQRTPAGARARPSRLGG